MKRGKIFSENPSLEEKREMGLEAGGAELSYAPELEETTEESEFIADEFGVGDEFGFDEDLFDPALEQEIFDGLNQEVDIAKVVSKYFSSRATYYMTNRKNQKNA